MSYVISFALGSFLWALLLTLVAVAVAVVVLMMINDKKQMSGVSYALVAVMALILLITNTLFFCFWKTRSAIRDFQQSAEYQMIISGGESAEEALQELGGEEYAGIISSFMDKGDAIVSEEVDRLAGQVTQYIWVDAILSVIIYLIFSAGAYMAMQSSGVGGGGRRGRGAGSRSEHRSAHRGGERSSRRSSHR